MNALISLKKYDHGQYDDVFMLTIETPTDGKRSVKISEDEYLMLLDHFPFIHTKNKFPYPDSTAETAY